MTRRHARLLRRRFGAPPQPPAPHPLGPWMRLAALVAVSAGFWLAMNVIVRL